MKLRAVALVTCLVLAAAPRSAHAQPDPVAALKQQGDDQMRALHFREALEKYDEAIRAGGGAALRYNRARAYEALEDYPRALDDIEEFVRTATPELRARVPRLDDLVADLRAHVGTLVVTSPIAGATIRVRHGVAGTTPLGAPLRVSVGDALVEVEAPGYRTFSRVVHLAAGETHVDASLERERVSAPARIPAAPTVHAGPWRPVGLAIGGGGLALVIAGAVFGGLAVGQKGVLDGGDCPGKLCDDAGRQARSEAYTYATLSTVGFVAGGVLAVSGVALFLLAPRAQRREALAPEIGPGWVGLRGTF